MVPSSVVCRPIAYFLADTSRWYQVFTPQHPCQKFVVKVLCASACLRFESIGLLPSLAKVAPGLFSQMTLSFVLIFIVLFANDFMA